MAFPRAFDIVVAGGGIAGSCFAGVMARAGFGVLLVEREAHFRDRVRGELTWPWGVRERERVELGEIYRRAEAIDLIGVKIYADRGLCAFNKGNDGQPNLMTFVHTRLQEEAFAWAAEQGATTLRPAKADRVRPGKRPSVDVLANNETREISTRLVVGADGKLSGIRRWTGGETLQDQEVQRVGGVQVSGVEWQELSFDFDSTGTRTVFWMPTSRGFSRIYIGMPARQMESLGITKSFESAMAYAGSIAPPGRLDGAVQTGPIAFFPNSDVWTTRVAGAGVTLIGDAAGSLDPIRGHGTSLLLRDVRELSEALLDDSDWQRAIDTYAERRDRYYGVLHAYDQWNNTLSFQEGPEGDRLRAGHHRAYAADPSIEWWDQLVANGPDGLVAGDAARKRYFGEDL